MPTQIKKLKRVVIKEEMVELTGDYRIAIILQQFIYWSRRVEDFDRFIQEEQMRRGEKLDIPLQHGWIWKKAEDLCSECMLFVHGANGEKKKYTKDTIRKYIKYLVEKGWLSERDNPDPKYGFDKTKQYRVNLKKINRDLKSIGYHLDGYAEITTNDTERELLDYEVEKIDYEVEKFDYEVEKIDYEGQKNRLRETKNSTAIPEITTEITIETTTENNTIAGAKNNFAPKPNSDQKKIDIDKRKREAEEIYRYYAELNRESDKARNKERALKNITKLLSEFSAADLKEAAKNYSKTRIAKHIHEPKYIKDPANFYGQRKDSRFFQDFLPGRFEKLEETSSAVFDEEREFERIKQNLIAKYSQSSNKRLKESS
jgi:hypothetical protein